MVVEPVEMNLDETPVIDKITESQKPNESHV